MNISLKKHKKVKMQQITLMVLVVFVVSFILSVFFYNMNKIENDLRSTGMNYFYSIAPILFGSISLTSLLTLVQILKEKKQIENINIVILTAIIIYFIYFSFRTLMEDGNVNFQRILWSVFGISIFNYIFIIIKIFTKKYQSYY
jgi:cytochrome c biogenesis factor